MSKEKLKPMVYWISIQMAYWISKCQKCAEHHGYICDECPEKHPCIQTQLQIKSLIESHDEHDEEFVDKEARNFLHSIQDIQYPFQLIKTKNFIRSLLSKVQKKAVCIFCALPINDDEGACKSCANQALKDLSKKPVVDKNWLPTAENINALPEPVRHYIAKLETNCDPPSMIQENIILRETCRALEIKLSEAEFTKEKAFVTHIENHLKKMEIDGKVICKICGKDIDLIALEADVEVEE